MNGASLRQLAAGYVADYLRELERLTNMDSGTHDVLLVQRVGEYVAGLFGEAGCSIEWVRSEDAAIADTYVARRGGGARTVVLLGHHDTVYPAGTAASRPFRIESGRAYGPGVMDMKGGVLLAVFAVRLLQEAKIDDLPTIVMVGNPDEEIGSPTSRPLIEHASRDADLVLVLEPGREPGSIQTTRKGVGMYEMVVHGRSSHAGSRPEDGRSAVLELAHKTIALHDLTNFDSGTTVNVGVVSGGSRRNVVPERAEALIDLRASSAQTADEADAAIRSIAQQQTIEGTHTTVHGGMNRPPMEKTADTVRALDVGRHLIAEMGLTFLETTSGGGSDGNFTAAAGVPTLDGLGPVGRNAHSPGEWLDTSTIAERLALVAGLIARAPARSR